MDGKQPHANKWPSDVGPLCRRCLSPHDLIDGYCPACREENRILHPGPTGSHYVDLRSDLYPLSPEIEDVQGSEFKVQGLVKSFIEEGDFNMHKDFIGAAIDEALVKIKRELEQEMRSVLEGRKGEGSDG